MTEKLITAVGCRGIKNMIVMAERAEDAGRPVGWLAY